MNSNGKHNVQEALRYADEIMTSVNATLANAARLDGALPDVSRPEKNTDNLLRELEATAQSQIPTALDKATIEETGKEVCGIMSKGCDEFKRQTGRNMTYSEMRRAYG
jgi:hypothetical protein